MTKLFKSLLLIVFASSVCAQDLIPIKTISYGISTTENASLEVKGQEAFVSAVVSGVRDILTMLGMQVESQMQVNDKGEIISDIITSNTEGSIHDFRINTQTSVINAEIAADVIQCDFRGEKIVLLKGKLAYPPVDMLTFPDYKPFPKDISGIRLKYLSSSLDKKTGELQLGIELEYMHDPNKPVNAKSQSLHKPVRFRYLTDAGGQYIYKTVSMEGTSFGGEDDTPKNVQDRAYDEACRNAVEFVNGVFIRSLTEIENAMLTRDEIMSQTLGIAKVSDKHFDSQFSSSGSFEVTCTVTARIPIMEILAE